MRYFIFLSYDGTAYHGWQIQPRDISVQQKLNECLSTLLREEKEVTGAGRTDTGVHAHVMAAHFDHEAPIDCAQLAHKLNRILPRDIAVQRVVPVRPDAHARFSATARTYHYWVYTEKSPFHRHYATRLFFRPDYELMNRAGEMLTRVSDFTSFSKLHTDVKTNICRVSTARWEQIDGDLWRFEIRADRFLRNMVRAVVGTLLEVGRHKLTLDEFSAIIEKKNRCAAGESMPANALSLVNVEYPADIFNVE